MVPFPWTFLLAASGPASAQCSCSVATAGATLPMGTVPSAGSGSAAFEYGIGQTGGEPWEGVVPASDRFGNSMPDMAMPGHLAQSARVALGVGLPEGFLLTASIPFVYSTPLQASDMPGDVPRGFVGDAAVGSRWGRRKGGTFAAVGLGATLPTGPVVRGVGVRGGRGAVGAVLDTTALQMVAPVVGLGGRLAWTQGLYRSPIDGWLVGPQADVLLGGRIWTREQGRLSFATMGLFVHRGHDRWNGEVLEETGSDVVSASGTTDWRVWSEEERSLVLSLGAIAPIVQVVGDPWLAENWSLSATAALGF